MLDFGEGMPVRARQDELSRECAPGSIRRCAKPRVVYVNGKLAGSVWHPPFTLDIGAFLRAGTNELKIVVANTAINELAGRAAPDYRLLWLALWQAFTPQDMDHLEPLPSGILGRVRIVPKGPPQR